MTKIKKLIGNAIGEMKTTNFSSGNREDKKVTSSPPNEDKRMFPLGRFPVYSGSASNKVFYSNSLRGNKYLSKQQSRILNAVKSGNLEKATKIGITLFQRSFSYQFRTLNLVWKGGYYETDLKEIKICLDKVRELTSTLDTNAKYYRSYIEKSHNKWRPLGVPRMPGRIVIKMITDIVTMMVEPTLGDFQFGFRSNRSPFMAGEEIIKKVKQGKKVFEFDLEACFNRISVSKVFDIMEHRYIWRPFAHYVRALCLSPPIFKKKELKYEQEIVKVYNSPRQNRRDFVSGPYIAMEDQNGITHLHRNDSLLDERRIDPLDDTYESSHTYLKLGLPQGGALSPILSILCIDNAIKCENHLGRKLDTIMYADDGLIFMDKEEEFTFKDRGGDHGMIMSNGLKKNGSKKSGYVNDIIDFLGITYSISRDSFMLFGEWKPNTLETGTLIKKDYQGLYSQKNNDDGSGTIVDNSYIFSFHRIISIKNFLFFLAWIMGYNSIRRFGLRFIDYAKISSEACEYYNKLHYDFPKLRRKACIHMGDKFMSDEYDYKPYSGRYEADLTLRKEFEKKRYNSEILNVDPFLHSELSQHDLRD